MPRHKGLLTLPALLLTAALALLAGCGGDTSMGLLPSGATVTPQPPSGQPTGACGGALAAQDLAGQCRSNPPSMGALEAVG